MSDEKKDAKIDGATPQVKLHEAYQPAEFDTVIAIRLLGNTARIVGIDDNGIDPFQLFAISTYLEHMGKKMLLQQEAEAIQAWREAEAKKPKIEIPKNIDPTTLQ